MGNYCSKKGKADSPPATPTVIDPSQDAGTAGEDEGNSSNVRLKPRASRSEGEILQAANVKSFAYAELKAATINFKPECLLGKGGFGSVFKGWINETTLEPAAPGSGLIVAVKKLNQDGFQGHEEWLTEINYLGTLSHPNLVKLIGYCLHDDQRLLVYEFMARGSLEDNLFKRGSNFPPLSWSLRMKIVLDAAKGLSFLHDDKVKVIFRDFKSSNVLLDSNYNAKLSDFGLARDGPTGDRTHVSTRIMGTYGYVAPEYVNTGHLTMMSDVYSFGVVLLEILTGRSAIDASIPTHEHHLAQWGFTLIIEGRFLELLDSRLQVDETEWSSFRKVALLAKHCLVRFPKLRPTMAHAVKYLDYYLREEPAGTSSSQSREARRRNTHRRSPPPHNSLT